MSSTRLGHNSTGLVKQLIWSHLLDANKRMNVQTALQLKQQCGAGMLRADQFVMHVDYTTSYIR